VSTADLRALARAHGIQLSFRDGTGTMRRASPDALLAVLQALGSDVRTPEDAPRALRRLRVHPSSRSRRRPSPRRVRAPRPPARTWGTFIPLYAVRSERSHGVADLTDLEALLAWTSKLGGRFVGTLPLYATYLDDPFDPSPYSPVSRLFFNELYVDAERTPEFDANPQARDLADSPAFRAEATALRDGDHVDHRRAYALRRQLLEELAATRSASLERRLREFRQREPRSDDYAAFRAQREPGDRAKAERFHRYAQLVVHEQLTALASSEVDGGLHLDLPVGVHPAGYDVHAFADAFVRGVSVGAPPDAFFRGGQNWGFPPLHPQRGIPYFRESIGKLASTSAVLRIDHVMGLARSYWIPEGFGADEGVYVRMPADELFGIVADEAARFGTVVVGEDLGTVPRSIPPLMRRHGIHSTYVVQFSLTDDDESPVALPRSDQLACVNTHDLVPFATFWADLPSDRRRAVSSWLGLPGRPDSADVVREILARLGRSDAPLVGVNLEDLWAETRPQNVPGTTSDEQPNWTRRSSKTLEQIVGDPRVLETLTLLSRTRDDGRRA
jgi:4-alpha-glucanotransferase